ncbi:MAG: hypothetical protein M3Y87_21465, partial [Myxococcota bacterium]|nr:hypothetical protein [Myxococcota bacterium]
AYGVCGGEGVCAPGATGSETCGDCGTQPTLCTEACTWESAGECASEGECAPGAMTRSGTGCPAGQQRDVTCSDACMFEPTSACTADGCETPGVIERVGCGTMCGTQERFCNATRTWEYGACEGAGACVPGTTGTAACGMCGMQTTRCNDACAWVTSGSCTGEGTCAPGTTRRTSAGCPAGATRLMQCSAACGYTIEVEPCRTTVPIDVLFLIDATPSNWYDFEDQLTTFVPRCVDALLALTDVQVGIAYYGDMSSPVEPFEAGVEIGAATSAAISTDISAQDDLGGGEDSTMEALSILTGATPATGSIPFVCSAGRVAGGCWRPGAERVIVMHTDEAARGGPLPTGTGVWNPWPTGPTWTTVLPRLTTDGTMLFTILDNGFVTAGSPVQQYERMVMDLGQPATDARLEGPTEPGLGVVCDAIVARVRTIAGL